MANAGLIFSDLIKLNEVESVLGEEPPRRPDYVKLVDDFHYHYRFDAKKGYILAHLVLKARVSFECQRCMAIDTQSIHQVTELALVNDLDLLDDLMNDFDCVTLGAPIDLANIANDELLLVLPCQHAKHEQCDKAYLQYMINKEIDTSNAKPFEELANLMISS